MLALLSRIPTMPNWLRTTSLSIALIALLVLGLSACGEYQCPAGYTAEYDDDGTECEQDSNGNGVDDENEGMEVHDEDAPEPTWVPDED